MWRSTRGLVEDPLKTTVQHNGACRLPFLQPSYGDKTPRAVLRTMAASAVTMLSMVSAPRPLAWSKPRWRTPVTRASTSAPAIGKMGRHVAGAWSVSSVTPFASRRGHNSHTTSRRLAAVEDDEHTELTSVAEPASVEETPLPSDTSKPTNMSF